MSNLIGRVSIAFVMSSFAAACSAQEPVPISSVSRGLDINVSPGSSIANAINSAQPGDRVLLAAGTYTGGGWIERSGSASAPITILSAGGPRAAVVQGGTESLRVGNSAYLVFDGLEVRNSGDNTIHIDNSHHITLRNIYAHDAGPNGDVLKVNQAHHITVELSEFARPGPRSGGANPYQECIDFVDVDDGIIRDNFIHDSGSMLAYIKGGARNSIIERNVFSQQRTGASDPAVGLGGATDLALLQGEQFEAINIVFRNNIIMNGVTGGLAVYDAQGAYIANNLFLNNSRVLIEFRAGEGPAARSENVQIVSNLFVDTRGQMPTPLLLSSHGLTGLSTSHNLFWNNGAAIPTTTLLTLTAQTGHLSTNPLVGVPAADANRAAILAASKPGTGSPAENSGSDTSGAPFGVTTDITGAARGARRDRGPFLLGTAVTVDAGVPTVDSTVPRDGSAVDASPPRDGSTVDASPPRDGSAVDASPPRDGSTAADAAHANDASPSADSRPAVDGSQTNDGPAGTIDAQTTAPDGGTPSADGASAPPGSSGCEVATPLHGSNASWTISLMLLAVISFRRAKRGRRN